MRRTYTVVMSALVLSACAEDTWVLSNVVLVDIESGTTTPGAAILVEDDRILNAGPAGTVEVPRGVRRIDGAGGYVIPGLWDMHVHLTNVGVEALSLMVANGVTGARDMGGDLQLVDELRAAIERGDVVGPRIVRAGRVVDGQKDLTDRYILATPDEGRAAVRELTEAGVDHIKIHNGLPRDVFFAVAAEAKRQGMSLVGHVPMQVHPTEAIAAGLTTVEHVATIFEGTVAGDLQHPADQLRRMREFAARGADTLAASFVRHGAWFTPTLVAYAVNSRLAALEESPDPRRRYIRPELVAHWDESFPIQPFELDPRVVAFRRQGDSAFAALVTTLHRHGAALLAGTDLGTREIYPGFSVHDELAMLVQNAGLTPFEALQAATLEPARYLSGTDSLGGIEAGRLADFVLLRRNPLDDIRNTTRIRAVAVNGVYHTRAELDAMLAAAERHAGRNSGSANVP